MFACFGGSQYGAIRALSGTRPARGDASSAIAQPALKSDRLPHASIRSLGQKRLGRRPSRETTVSSIAAARASELARPSAGHPRVPRHPRSREISAHARRTRP